MAGERVEKATNKAKQNPLVLEKGQETVWNLRSYTRSKLISPIMGERTETPIQDQGQQQIQDRVWVYSSSSLSTFLLSSLVFSFFQFPIVTAVRKQMIFLLICHLTTSQEVWVEYDKIFWKRNHIHITFITVFVIVVLLLVIVVNLFCAKFINFTIGMYV